MNDDARGGISEFFEAENKTLILLFRPFTSLDRVRSARDTYSSLTNSLFLETRSADRARLAKRELAFESKREIERARAFALL